MVYVDYSRLSQNGSENRFGVIRINGESWTETKSRYIIPYCDWFCAILLKVIKVIT